MDLFSKVVLLCPNIRVFLGCELITVPTSLEFPINCTERDTTINILNVTAVAHQNTNASHKPCNVTRLVKYEFKHLCNEKQSCIVFVNDTLECLQDYGYFNLSFTCRSVTFDCNFTNGFCNWENRESGNCQWDIRQDTWKEHYISPVGNSGTVELYYPLSFQQNNSCLRIKYWSNSCDKSNFFLSINNNQTVKAVSNKSEKRYLAIDINETGYINITIGLECGVCVFYIYATSFHPGKCLDEGKYQKAFLDMEQLHEITECGTSELEFDKNSFQFSRDLETCPTYDNITTNLLSPCSNTESNKDCSFRPLELIKAITDCIMVNQLLVEYECEALSSQSTESSTNFDNTITAKPKMVAIKYTAVGIGSGVAAVICLVALLIYCWCKRKSKVNAAKRLTSNIEIWPTPQPYDEIGLDNIQPTSRNQEIDIGGHNGVNDSDGGVRRVENEQKTAKKAAYDEIDLDSDIMLKSANSIDNSESTRCNVGTELSKNYVILDPKETGFNRLVQGSEHEPTLTSGRECMKDDTNVKHQKVNNTDKKGKSLYKVDDEIIYSHAIDNVYDKAGYNVQTNKFADNYDHVVRTKTGDM